MYCHGIPVTWATAFIDTENEVQDTYRLVFLEIEIKKCVGDIIHISSDAL